VSAEFAFDTRSSFSSGSELVSIRTHGLLEHHPRFRPSSSSIATWLSNQGSSWT
jgi:hypothetical protein